MHNIIIILSIIYRCLVTGLTAVSFVQFQFAAQNRNGKLDKGESKELDAMFVKAGLTQSVRSCFCLEKQTAFAREAKT